MNKLSAIIFTAGIILFSAMTSFAQNEMRFHCSNDTTEIHSLLSEGHSSGKKSSELMIFFAERLIGKPYVANTLEGEKELLTINIDEFDCMTFVETTMALSATSSASNPTWRDYARTLTSIRYRKGIIDGYASRKHYVADWITDNIYRGNIIEITRNFENYATMTKSLNYMTHNKENYPALNDSTNYAELRYIEMGYFSHKIPYLKKQSVTGKSSISKLQDGDIIVFLTKENGLDATHMAIIKRIEDEAYLIHASSKEGRVILEESTLKEYFKHNARSCPGVRILRICD